MLCIAMALALAAAPAAQPIKLAAPGLTPLNLSADEARFYSDHLAQQLAVKGIRVVTPSEITALLGLQRQKDLMGCSESSCIAELAGALGVDGIITGNLGKFGKEYQLNIKILDARDGRALSVHTSRPSGESSLLDQCTLAANAAAQDLVRELRPEWLKAPGATHALRRYSWVPLAVGAVGAGVGTAMLVQAGADHRALLAQSAPSSGETAEALRDRGARNQAIGWAGVGVGMVGVAAAAALFFAPVRSSEVQVLAAGSGQGAWVGVGGVLP